MIRALGITYYISPKPQLITVSHLCNGGNIFWCRKIYIPVGSIYLVIYLNRYLYWPLENKVPMRGPYAFYPGVELK